MVDKSNLENVETLNGKRPHEFVETLNGKRPHSFFNQFVEDYRAGRLSRREFLAYSTGVGVTAASALSIVGGSVEARAQTPKRGGTLRVSMNVREISDPASYEWNEMGNGSRDILEYLVKWNADGSFTPWLLESWDLSSDGKIWTLKLRRGVTWNNGDDFTSEDVAFNINRWLDRSPATTMQSRFPGLLEEYDTGDKDEEGKAVMAQRGIANAVEIVNRYTVRLNSETVDISFIPSMADYPAAIVHRDFEKMGSDILANPIGTGAFTLKEYKVQERIVKERREDYWGEPAYLDRVVFIDLKDDPAQVYAAFSTDQIDLAFQVQADQVERMEGIGGLTKYEVPTAATGVIRFNKKQAPFDDHRLRRAIQLCADNAATLKVAHNNAGVVAEHHHVAPIHPEYFKLAVLKRNLAEAKKLLKESGFAGGEVECTAVNSPDWESQACLALAAQASEAGLTINVNILPGDAFWERWEDWPFSMTGWNGRPLGTQIYNLAYRSNGVWNETAYDNAEFDSLLDKASGIADAGERSKLMGKMEKMLQDDAIMVQPLWRGLFNYSHKRVKNYTMHPAFVLQFDKVWLDA